MSRIATNGLLASLFSIFLVPCVAWAFPESNPSVMAEIAGPHDGQIVMTSEPSISYPLGGYFSISLMPDQRTAVLAGDIAHGIARRLAEFLNQSPTIDTIALYSEGGRMSEAGRIRDLVRDRKLDTLVFERCLSSCTIAFAGGRKRFLDMDGQLGFHELNVPDRFEFDNDGRRDRKFIEDLVSLGVDARFAEKAYNIPANEMWFPTFEELMKAGFITGSSNRVISGSPLVSRQYQVDPLEGAISALERGDYVNALRLFRPLANEGKPFAQFAIGFLFSNGLGVQSDHEESAKWYRLAANQGYATAQNNLGIYYSKGQGVPRDEAKAVAWFQKAAEQGETRAQVNLGRRYYQGVGVPQNFVEAVKWYLRAADQGDATAQGQLGYMYGFGEGVARNYVLAHMWLNLASSRFPTGSKEQNWAADTRAYITALMTPRQIAEAQRLASDWRPR